MSAMVPDSELPDLDVVVAANIAVHSRMADTYDTDEPHFRPENKEKVRGRLERLSANGPRVRLLDIGCGTGFMISLASDLFEHIDGLDATRAMLDRVDVSSGNVEVHEGLVERMPFLDATFDMVTAYAFLHHLVDHRPALREAARVLKPGGQLYVDLEPNRAYWAALSELEARGPAVVDALDPVVRREIDAVLHVDDDVANRFDIPQEVFQAAEFGKEFRGGFDPDELRDDVLAAGFASCTVHLDWYAGQATVMHGESFEAAATVDEHLRRLMPMTRHLFKYLWVEATRQ